MNTPTIKWNNEVKIIFADVDETIADVYKPATSEMIAELEKVLEEGKLLFLVSGGGLQSITERIVSKIKPDLRKSVLISLGVFYLTSL
jgi:hydroxymethylpyrimidine pyrophosphatase-like HAD family hydrolase